MDLLHGRYDTSLRSLLRFPHTVKTFIFPIGFLNASIFWARNEGNNTIGPQRHFFLVA